MKTLLLIVSFALALLVGVGCSTLKADPRLVGTYNGANAENLTFQSDRGVQHRRVIHGREQKTFLGYARATGSGTAGEFSIRSPDASAFIGTSFQISADYSSISVQWHDRQAASDVPRQTMYKRTGR